MWANPTGEGGGGQGSWAENLDADLCVKHGRATRYGESYRNITGERNLEAMLSTLRAAALAPSRHAVLTPAVLRAAYSSSAFAVRQPPPPFPPFR